MITWFALFLLALYTLDRLAKHMAVWVFFRRGRPAAPAALPADQPPVTLIQPVTRSPNDLRAVLAARARLVYPGLQRQVLVCDEQDAETLALVDGVRQTFPGWQPVVVLAAGRDGPVATKLEKMAAGLAAAQALEGEVLCFVDDDIVLPADAMQILTANLARPGVGAVFGLACYTNWQTPWAALMSAFVNSNALLSYIPFTFFLEPFTITGHCYAFRRQVFEAAGGLAQMEGRQDDDHELARRIRATGLRLCQTPMVYGVDNAFDSWRSYAVQMKRWFVFPRQAMLPFMTPLEQAASLLGTAGNLIPGVLLALALVSREAGTWLAWAASLGLFSLVYLLEERLYLPQRTPAGRYPWVLVSALLAPIQVVWALFSDDVIEWRGQRMRILRGGGYKRE